MINQTFTINGMHCDACTKLTSKRISKINGVRSTVVDLKSKTAHVEAEHRITVDEINTELKSINYWAEEK